MNQITHKGFDCADGAAAELCFDPHAAHASGVHGPFQIPWGVKPASSAQESQDRRHAIFSRAELAFQEAMAATSMTGTGRRKAGSRVANDRHLEAAAQLIVRTDALIALPLRDEGDTADRREILARFGQACSTHPTANSWRIWQAHWEAKLTAAVWSPTVPWQD